LNTSAILVAVLLEQRNEDPPVVASALHGRNDSFSGGVPRHTNAFFREGNGAVSA